MMVVLCCVAYRLDGVAIQNTQYFGLEKVLDGRNQREPAVEERTLTRATDDGKTNNIWRESDVARRSSLPPTSSRAFSVHGSHTCSSVLFADKPLVRLHFLRWGRAKK